MTHKFSYYLEKLNEFGTTQAVSYPFASVVGLPGAKPHELVLFESGEQGEVYSLGERSVDVLLFSTSSVTVGTKIVRTNNMLSVGLGSAMLGYTIDPLGRGLPQESDGQFFEQRQIDIKPMGIAHRARVKRPFKTGSIIVDMMVPLGMGQKELVIGDRKTGKSAFLFTTIKSQVLNGSIAVYAAIGKQKTDIKDLAEMLEREGLMHNVVLVATSSSDSPSLIYLTPFTAMCVAEYFRDQGRDVVIVMDDLSTHAKRYREISLLARSFPGRDSYPGDIFYTHARLLERAGNFKHAKAGEVSITCLPVVETVEADMVSFIATTLMGISDGHVYFDSDIFYTGKRPAVNIGLSVTRVGKQTQSALRRSITRELTSFLTLHAKMQKLSHFGTELTDSVKNILATGDKIYMFFDQHYNLIIPEAVQLVIFSLLWLKFIDPDAPELEELRTDFIKAYKNKDVVLLFDEILQAESFNDLLRNTSARKDQILALWKKNIK